MARTAVEKAGVQSTPAAHGLHWLRWEDVYVVFQPSSAETHVFNETTALVLRALEHGPLPAECLKAETEAALGVQAGDLGGDDFAFALARLEELGLIDRENELTAVR